MSDSGAGGPPPPPPFVEPYPGYLQESRGSIIVGVTAALTVLATLFVIGRVYSRMISVGKVFIDDWIMILSIILGWVYVGMGAAAVSWGGGKHQEALTMPDFFMIIKLTTISFAPGLSSFMFPKFAVVILLAKLLNPSRLHLRIMWAISITYFLMIVAMLALNFGQCTPAAAAWGEVPGKCMDRAPVVHYAMAVTVASILFDLYLAIYPTIVLWNLNVNVKKKIALCASLGFGYCAAAVTIYKCTTFPPLLTNNGLDYSYGLGDVYLWTNIEANFVIIGACIPLMLPLAKKIFGSSAFGGSTAPSKGPSGKSSGKSGDSKGVSNATFGSNQKTKKSRKGTAGFDTVNDDSDSKYIILEERSFHYNETTRDADETSQNERAKAARPNGW